MWCQGEMAGVIGADSEFIFLLDNDSTVSLKSKGVQGCEVGDGKKWATHEYYITLDNLTQLLLHKTKSIRKYLSDGYVDNAFKDSWNEDFNNLMKVFLREYEDKVEKK